LVGFSPLLWPELFAPARFAIRKQNWRCVPHQAARRNLSIVDLNRFVANVFREPRNPAQGRTAPAASIAFAGQATGGRAAAGLSSSAQPGVASLRNKGDVLQRDDFGLVRLFFCAAPGLLRFARNDGVMEPKASKQSGLARRRSIETHLAVGENFS
jgi:hypothetical protein